MMSVDKAVSNYKAEVVWCGKLLIRSRGKTTVDIDSNVFVTKRKDLQHNARTEQSELHKDSTS